MSFWLPAIMGGIGLLQGAQKDKQAREQMKLNAMQQRFAPLFGQAPGAPQAAGTPGALASGLAGALGGYQTGLNYDMMKNAMNKAGTSPSAGTGTGLVAMNTRPDQNPYNMGRLAGVYIGNPSDPGDDQGRQTYG